MSTGSILFMAASWTFVLGLTGWSFFRILRRPKAPGAREDEPPAGG